MNMVRMAIQKFLRRFDYQLRYAPRGRVNGLNFRDDARLLIRSQSPVCFDIGANEGQTIELFKIVFDQPKIHAFEPGLAAFDKIRSRFEKDPNVSLYRTAMGSESAMRDLITYDDSRLSSFLPIDKSMENRFRDLRPARSEKVKILTVDSFVQENRIERIDILKIDTQGFDLEVLKGAAGSLEKGIIQYVFLELNFVKMYSGQGKPSDITDFLASYNLYLIDFYEKVRQDSTIAWCSALYGKRRADASQVLDSHGQLRHPAPEQPSRGAPQKPL
jgi:FkbM family methyltransferase